MCVLMDLAHFACQLAGLVVPGHHAVPCPRSISTLLVLFRAGIACANCTASWTVSTKLHQCWRPRCFVRMFLWDALTGTDLDRVSAMFGVCTLRTGSSQLTWWFNTCWKQQAKVLLTPKFAHFMPALVVGRTFLPLHLCFSPSWKQ